MTPDTATIDTAGQRFIKINIEKVIALHEAGYTDQAIEQYADILSLYPDNNEVLFRLARLYLFAGRAEEALPLLRRIAAHSPYYADALYMLGMMLGDRRDFAGGADCLTRVLELDDSRVECYNHLSRFLIELGRPDEAYTHLARSLQLAPDNADTYNHLGNLIKCYWRLTEAGEQYRRAIALKPDYASAYNNLGWLATLEGKIPEALELLRTALTLQPDFRIAASNLLFTLNYFDGFTSEQIHDEHLRLAVVYNEPVRGLAVHQRRQGDKIRVGYVSGDFKTHSVAFFLEPVLRCHNRGDFEIYCYDMVSVPDETTRRMMGLGWAWRAIYGLSDSAVAEQVRADGIDILVDLAGHTEANRLGVFALRPAPLQVSWLGYPNTTGLKQINYRLTDGLADPPGMTDHLHVERLVRLPRSFLCYAPPASAPVVAPLPEAPITFCCFNHYPKISDTTIRLWARVMHALPGSLLSLKNGSLRDETVCDRLIERFFTCGIERPRLILAARSMTREEHLQRYGACHIALDTYPYTGTTTTCEALWMGVPVVTLAGENHASRVGVSLLTNAGLPELIATNADQYVEIAAALGRNPERLQAYRRSLREQLLGSSLMNIAAFTDGLEQAYQWMMTHDLG
jgi:protein O-GlcNAc transferase